MSEGIITRRIKTPTPLLLDSFPNSAAAYSLRSLKLSGRNNPVVKVRRDSDDAEQDFSPAEINDGSLLTFVGNTASDNGFVTTIYDQSGNGNDYTQPTATKQGVLVSSGSLNLLNGKPVILRSADDGGSYLSAYAPNDGADPKIYFYVGKNGNNSACIFGAGNGGPNYGYISESGSSSTAVNNSVVAANEKLNNQALSYTTRDDFYQETVNQFLLSADITFNFNFNEKSIGYRFNGEIFGMFAFQEEIIYLGDTTNSRVGIETNINNHYGIY